MKHTKQSLSNAFAATAGFVWVVCSLGVALFPGPSYMMNRWFMHESYGLTMGNWNVTIQGFFLGGFVLIAFSWVTGYFFASALEYFSKK